jgi:hypothetical protein
MEQLSHNEVRLELGRDLIPDHMFGAVKRYIMQGIPPGSFLTAVICNDLREAFARADDQNAAAMHGWIKFFYNYTPSGCWGSPDAYRGWMASFRGEAA